jgi:serine/threonine protein phosphatase PrpC
MQFSIYQESRRGLNQQDRTAYCYSRNALLMLVADGMGGHLHGEAAAEIATQFITGTFRREASPLADPAQFLRRAIVGAHHAIIEHAAGRLTEAPLTTLRRLRDTGQRRLLGYAGDSRLSSLSRQQDVGAAKRPYARAATDRPGAHPREAFAAHQAQPDCQVPRFAPAAAGGVIRKTGCTPGIA